MHCIRCDQCGKQVELRTDGMGMLGISLRAGIGVNMLAEVHACSVACFDGAMAKAVAKARTDFERLAKEMSRGQRN